MFLPHLEIFSVSFLEVININYSSFNRYYTLRASNPDLLQHLYNINLADLQQYMHWYLNKHNIKKLNTFYI
jgi:hypothetical protein